MQTKKKPTTDDLGFENSKLKTPKPSKTATTLPALYDPSSSTKEALLPLQAQKTTKIIVKYDVGFGNSLSIRGKGANLSWTRGILLKNTSNDEWIWESPAQFNLLEFKILVNDTHYEFGDNHLIKQGETAYIHPHF